MISQITSVIINESRQISQNPFGLWASGIPYRFIPKAELIMVGTVSTIVMTDRTFMTMFRLFDIIEAKVSIVPARISL